MVMYSGNRFYGPHYPPHYLHQQVVGVGLPFHRAAPRIKSAVPTCLPYVISSNRLIFLQPLVPNPTPREPQRLGWGRKSRLSTRSTRAQEKKPENGVSAHISDSGMVAREHMRAAVTNTNHKHL